MSLASMSLEALIFNLAVLADIENFKAYESEDYMKETAYYYRESVIREAMRRLGDDI